MSDRHWLQVIERVLNAETGNLRELAEIADEDPATLYIGTSMDGADIRGQDLRGMRFTHLDLAKVKFDTETLLDPNDRQRDDHSNVPSPLELTRAAGRQEERIAIILRLILERKFDAITFIHAPTKDDLYYRAKFERTVFDYLREKFPLEQRDLIDTGDEMIIADMVQRLFSSHYTMARGELLFFLSKHLGQWPLINTAIRQTLERTRAVFVDNFRPEIKRMLDEFSVIIDTPQLPFAHKNP